MAEFVTLINQMGFPIACVCALFWMLNKDRETHKLENDKFVEAINNNTQVLNALMTKLDFLVRGDNNDHL